MECTSITISNFKFVKDNAINVEVWNSQIDTEQWTRELEWWNRQKFNSKLKFLKK